MLLNSDQVEKFLQTNNKGAKAQVGYDLTLKSVKMIINGGAVMVDKTIIEQYHEVMPTKNTLGKFIYKLDPGTYSLTFEQGVKLDTKSTAFIRHRSSILRCGGIITSGIYDSGFEVEEMGAVLIATKPIIIEKGARVAQIYIFENYEAEAYNGNFMGKKDIK
jgi:deoxycytidine triphosphate deaminase